MRATESDQARGGLEQARARLDASVEQLMRAVGMIADGLVTTEVLRASYDLMFVCADCASRIDRKLVPRLVRPEIEAEAKKAWQARAGRGGGTFRRREAEETWRPHALDLARKICEERPITKDDLVADIRKRWRLKVICPERALENAIRKWEKEGKLQRSKPERRKPRRASR